MGDHHRCRPHGDAQCHPPPAHHRRGGLRPRLCAGGRTHRRPHPRRWPPAPAALAAALRPDHRGHRRHRTPARLRWQRHSRRDAGVCRARLCGELGRVARRPHGDRHQQRRRLPDRHRAEGGGARSAGDPRRPHDRDRRSTRPRPRHGHPGRNRQGHRQGKGHQAGDRSFGLRPSRRRRCARRHPLRRRGDVWRLVAGRPPLQPLRRQTDLGRRARRLPPRHRTPPDQPRRPPDGGLRRGRRRSFRPHGRHAQSHTFAIRKPDASHTAGLDHAAGRRHQAEVEDVARLPERRQGVGRATRRPRRVRKR